MDKWKTITFGQEFKGGHLHDLTSEPYIMEPWAMNIGVLYKCGWKLRRKVTFYGKDVSFVAGFARHMTLKSFKFTYHLVYEGDKKCLRIPNFEFSPSRKVCDGSDCFYHHKLGRTLG